MIAGLDANIFIYVLDDASPFSASARALLTRLERTKTAVYASTIARTEILHQPYQLSPVIGKQAQQLLNDFSFVQFVDVSADIADKAAELCGRAGAKLKNVDAIHLATALASGATEFWTNDHELLKIKLPGLTIKALEEGAR